MLLIAGHGDAASVLDRCWTQHHNTLLKHMPGIVSTAAPPATAYASALHQQSQS
jgi:hypothetical protein